jgi:predicted Zn-dependent protease with MMP-like domain
MTMREFRRTARQVIDALPEPFHAWLDNVNVDIESAPSSELLADLDMTPGEPLLGLFQGTPVTEREFGEPGWNAITLFKRPIEDASESVAEIAYEIRRTLLHELAHHFGLDEADLDAFEAQPSPFDPPDDGGPPDRQPPT